MGKILMENLVQSLVLTVLRSGFHLKEVLEGLQLNLQKIRIFQLILNGGKTYTVFTFIWH